MLIRVRQDQLSIRIVLYSHNHYRAMERYTIAYPSLRHFLTLLCSLAVTFLSRLLVNLTLSLHLVPFSLVILTKSLVYLSAAFPGDRCDVILAASYLLSDSIATLCRLPSVSLLPSSLLTSNRACLLPGSSTLVPWLLHAGYHIPQTNQ